MSFLKAFFALFILCFPTALRAEDYENVYPVSIHIHSNLSSGARPVSQIAAIAKKQRVGALILTDLYHEKYEYGLWPFRGIFKKVIERDSVMKTGPELYFREIEKAEEENPEILVLDGTAVTPFYYWTGSLWPGPLVLNSRARDLLILGLGSPEKYRKLPILANGRSGFDAYHGEQYGAPYQKLIDEALRRGGLVFWSHPEAEEHAAFKDKILGTTIFLDTPPYTDMLSSTFNYTGFGLFATDLTRINTPDAVTPASAGGVWDRLLNQYCSGTRNAVWAIGEADFNGIENGIMRLDGILNMIFAPAKTREEILKAIASGRVYVITPASSESRLLVDLFQVRDPVTSSAAAMGQEAVISSSPKVDLKISFSDASRKPLEVLLIRNGEVIHQWNQTAPFNLSYEDQQFPTDRKSYYRIIAYAENGPDRLVTNPVFMEPRRDH